MRIPCPKCEGDMYLKCTECGDEIHDIAATLEEDEQGVRNVYPCGER